MSLERDLLVRPGKKFRLSDHNPDDTLGYKDDGSDPSGVEEATPTPRQATIPAICFKEVRAADCSSSFG